MIRRKLHFNDLILNNNQAAIQGRESPERKEKTLKW
jgi:hypothetical protein